MFQVYLAGPCDSDNRTMMVHIAGILRKLGFSLYCPFELKIPNAWDMSQEDWAQEVFNKDIEAINECDFMIMISTGRKSTAGTNWEQGYAFALKKPIYVFQVTDAPTSLMTYCGCTSFYGRENDIEKQIRSIVGEFFWGRDKERKEPCKTILT